MHVLYKIKSGSHLYGLSTPASDVDYVGVYLEDTFEEHMDIFNSKDEIDMSIKSKLETGKNDSNAVDEKYYSLKKFLKLCSECNPNIVEMLFCSADCIEFVDQNFKKYVLDMPEMFINIKLIDRFIGYAKSQEQKSYTKSENYVKLDKFKGLLEHKLTGLTNNDHVPLIERLYNPVTKRLALGCADIVKENVITHSKDNTEVIFEVGDMKFPSGLHTKDAIARIEDRFKRASHRVDGILINKYEPKFLSHTVRLLDEGCQLLTKKRIDFPFTGQTKKDIMDIKLGITPIEDIPELINKYKDQLEVLEVMDNGIPAHADRTAINTAYLNIVLHTYGIFY